MYSTIPLAADRWSSDVHHWHGFPFGIFLVVGVVVFVVSRRRRMVGGWPTGGSAQRILDERYARGELDAEEYRVRTTVLGERRAAQHGWRHRG